MKLFQYWDTGEPPEDVAACIESVWRLNPELEHRLYDRDRANQFIDKYVGAREAMAFRSLMVPAMQADYFRLCALWAEGGFWLDADCESQGALAGLLSPSDHGSLSTLEGFLQTSFMAVRASRNTFLRAFLDVSTANIEGRRFDYALIATGSYVADAIRSLIDTDWAAEAAATLAPFEYQLRYGRLFDLVKAEVQISPTVERHFLHFRLRDLSDCALAFTPKKLGYKSTPKDWRRWEGPVYA